MVNVDARNLIWMNNEWRLLLLFLQVMIDGLCAGRDFYSLLPVVRLPIGSSQSGALGAFGIADDETNGDGKRGVQIVK